MPTGPTVRAIPTADPDWNFYLYALVDVPGVAAANNFLSIFNPNGSGRAYVGYALNISSYAIGPTTTANSMTATRTTSASGGTLVAASTIPRFSTAAPDPVTQVRINNPTVTPSGLPLIGVPPVISTGTGTGALANAQAPSGAGFILYPNQGAVISTAAGDTDQVWNIQIIFAEFGL